MKKTDILNAYFENGEPIALYTLEDKDRILEFFNTVNTDPNGEHVFTRKSFSTRCRIEPIGCNLYDIKNNDVLLAGASRHFCSDQGSLIDTSGVDRFLICGFSCKLTETTVNSQFLALDCDPKMLNDYDICKPESRRQWREANLKSTNIDDDVKFLIGFDTDDDPDSFGSRAYIYEMCSIRTGKHDVELVEITEILDASTPYKSRLFRSCIVNPLDPLNPQVSQPPNWELFIYNEPAD